MKVLKICSAAGWALSMVVMIYFSVTYVEETIFISLLIIAMLNTTTVMLVFIEEKKKVEPNKPGTIDNKAENDEKRFSNSYPSLGHIGEDEHDPLTECERNYAIYMAKHASDN